MMLRNLELTAFIELHRFKAVALVLLLTVVAGMLTPAYAVVLPTDFNDWEVARTLLRPTAMEFAPDGRLFVLEKEGQVRVIREGVLLSEPFLSLEVDSHRERGLLGIAFDPDFGTTPYLYLYYTSPTPSCHNVVSRFTANGDVVVPGSEIQLIDIGPCGEGGHNAGAIHFGADGKLYIAVGEQNIGANAQQLTNLFGKLLRINTDGTIPTDNPFYDTALGDNRSIWALGFRNPFTFAIQPGTDRIFLNDVGSMTWEEINDVVRGGNYGWPETEGPTPDPRFISPIYAYGHGEGPAKGCAITGGAFYNPVTAQFPSEYIGTYFFADYCTGWIRLLDPDADNAVSNFAAEIDLPVDLKVGPDGALYYLTRTGGPQAGFVNKIQHSSLPGISRQPADLSVSPGEQAIFRVTASGNTPYTYQWQRDGENIPGATTRTYQFVASNEDDGAQFRCMVSNGAGTVTSRSAILDVIAGGPTATPTSTATSTVPTHTPTATATAIESGEDRLYLPIILSD